MNLGKNKTNSLLVGIFIAYWLFVVLSQVISIPRIDYIKQTIPGQLLFPPTYKMYTSPPKQIVQSEYTFYKDNEVIQRMDVDSLFYHRIKTGFPRFIVKRDVKQYMMLFYSPNMDLANGVYKYAVDSMAQKELGLTEYLNEFDLYRNHIHNQLDYADVVVENYPAVFAPDSVKLEINRKFNLIEIDPETREKFAYYIQDSTIVITGKKLNDVRR